MEKVAMVDHNILISLSKKIQISMQYVCDRCTVVENKDPITHSYRLYVRPSVRLFVSNGLVTEKRNFYFLFKINVAKGGKRHLHATQLTKPWT